MKTIHFISALLLFPGFLYSETDELGADLNTNKLAHKGSCLEKSQIKEEAEESLLFQNPQVFII